MAFGDGVPDEIKRSRTKLAWMSFAGDLVAAGVVLLFLLEDLGDMGYVLAAMLVAFGTAFLYMFPRLPYRGPQSSKPPEDALGK